jgi:hypothetical protein
MTGLFFLTALAVAQDQPATAIPGGAAVKLVLARPFTLAEPAPYFWQKEHPAYDAGWLVVLKVPPEMSRPRQVEVPVLYAGSVPAELLNVGYPAGVLVVLVPGSVDLEHTPFYYGPQTLPERVDAAYGAQVLAAASAKGIAPRPTSEWTEARKKGGAVVSLGDRGDVDHQAADLIDAYAPSEHERAETYRLTP